MKPYTDVQKIVKKALIDMDKTQGWLIDEVKRRSGLYFDSSYLGKVLRGEAKSTRITTAICDALGLPTLFEQKEE